MDCGPCTCLLRVLYRSPPLGCLVRGFLLCGRLRGFSRRRWCRLASAVLGGGPWGLKFELFFSVVCLARYLKDDFEGARDAEELSGLQERRHCCGAV